MTICDQQWKLHTLLLELQNTLSANWVVIFKIVSLSFASAFFIRPYILGIYLLKYEIKTVTTLVCMMKDQTQNSLIIWWNIYFIMKYHSTVIKKQKRSLYRIPWYLFNSKRKSNNILSNIFLSIIKRRDQQFNFLPACWHCIWVPIPVPAIPLSSQLTANDLGKQ